MSSIKDKMKKQLFLQSYDSFDLWEATGIYDEIDYFFIFKNRLEAKKFAAICKFLGYERYRVYEDESHKLCGVITLG